MGCSQSGCGFIPHVFQGSVEDSSVDAVVSTQVLCSVPDVPAVLDEVYRILKPVSIVAVVGHRSKISFSSSWRKNSWNFLQSIESIQPFCIIHMGYILHETVITCII